MLQRRLLGVLLVGWGEVVDRVLDDVVRVHGLLEAAGDALHGSATTCWGQDGEGHVKDAAAFPHALRHEGKDREHALLDPAELYLQTSFSSCRGNATQTVSSFYQ